MRINDRNAVTRLTLLASLFLVGTSALGQQQQQPPSDIPRAGELGGPGRVLTAEETDRWLRGRRLFDLAMPPSRGLGAPEMNADSCRGCHQDPILGGAGGLELNVSRFGRYVQGKFQDLPGGQGLSKLFPPTTPGREEHASEANVFEQRQTPAIFGAGLIETISDAAITANEDPQDDDKDGVRGVARRLTVQGATEIGRFGWKAQVPSLADFVRDAMGGELGMTTPSLGRGFAMVTDGDLIGDPELSQAEVDDMAFFMANLGPPLRRNPEGPVVQQGEALFASIGCATCHVPTLPGTRGPVALYSNLLLHDVMPSNYRGMSEPGAGPGLFRTPPLWGIRHSAPYMHDGRAENLREAILAHASEGQRARDAFEALSAPEQQALLRFLKDL
jgi:hypothetical protein